MGPSPKPPKSARKRQTTVPALRAAKGPPLPQRPRTVPVCPTEHQTRIPSGPSYETEVRITGVPDLLEQAAGVDDDRYFRITPGGEGHSWYLCCTWRWGKWAKHYVMAVVGRGDLHYGFILLAEKVARVEAGLLKPTPDRYDSNQ